MNFDPVYPAAVTAFRRPSFQFPSELSLRSDTKTCTAPPAQNRGSTRHIRHPGKITLAEIMPFQYTLPLNKPPLTIRGCAK
jgi:hypothetical protein